MGAAAPEIERVDSWLRGLPSTLCAEFESLDGGAEFREDRWESPAGGGGITRVLEDGAVLEKAGVNFSRVTGDSPPPSATAARPTLAGKRYTTMGVSLVVHPGEPARAHDAHERSLLLRGRRCWGFEFGAWCFQFGGGIDLTPYYGYEEDAVHWHTAARAACEPFGAEVYPRFKKWCDDYFFLKHRGEARGIGGLFFDDLNEGGFERSFGFARAVGDAFLPAYAPIVRRRAATPFGAREREFQLFRRGRYVEFNLVHDRGTLFGLQSGGRTESILMSLPPLVAWKYDWKPEPHSPEAWLCEQFLKPRAWAGE